MTKNSLLAPVLALPLLLVACADAEAPEDPDVQDAAALGTQEPAPEAAELALDGQWQVIAHNNLKLPSVFPAIARFGDDGTMTVNSACVTMRFALNREGNMIAPEHLGTDTGGCDRPQTDGEVLIEDVVPQSNIIADTGHELLISGPGGTLRLAPVDGAAD
ncbi:hypothetical protein [Sphingomicrobium astaxanthinifaciens]|uniref:hypothetical protein n=1 Tax=Sphingomicrobium astaxanthinifaciens TaxID=1227949 RepID=UPI001FCC8C65|nr:hypothetical protein [Sphingomicrobium astaxanthinifaciens]MCJ7421145.1 hypothetical protein [Sphingomicrobium astaxanthinifaciens]